MAWLEAHQELRDHPKIKRAARVLGINRPQMIGHMLCLWWWCLDYAQDGDLSDFDNADIADAAEWEGDPEAFVSALLNCGPADRPGFLIASDDGLTINDWQDYGGKFIAKRGGNKVRQARHRERNAPGNTDETSRNALVTHDNDVTNAPTVQYSTEQKITEQDRTEEEITTEITTTSLSEEAPTNGVASSAVGPSSVTVLGLSFLTRIGFQNPDRFIDQVDHTLLAQWGYYYSCLNETEKSAVHNWPALINDRVRNSKPPRWKNDAQKTRFYQELASA
jgi:hypothetical protein